MRKSITTSLGITCLALTAIVGVLLEDKRLATLEAEKYKASSGNYSGMLAACLNGKPLYDRLSGHALFTEKAVSVDLIPIRSKNGR